MALVLIALLATLVPVQMTRAAGPVVTNLNDSGTGSLRDAIGAAASGDTTTFRSGITGTITLTSGILALARSVTIQGPGASALTVDGGSTSPTTGTTIFTVGSSNATAVTISGLTLQHGRATAKCGPNVCGGAITVYQGGTLTLSDSVVRDNTANGAGGAIQNGGGMLNVTNSTVSGNTSTTTGGGLASTAGTLNVTNSTISGNSARSGGGLFVNIGAATLTDVTLASNTSADGGNISTTGAGSTTLKNSIVANAMGTNCSGAVSDGGYNLDSADACGFAATNHSLVNADSKLGPLQNNGGTTFTHALLVGSPAIDAGGTSTNGCPATDQRGIPRPQGAACDIGAFEYAASSSSPTSGTPTTNTGGTTAPSGSCTPLMSNSPFAFAGFQSQWQKGEALAPNFWGPTVSVGLLEQYVEGTANSQAGQRLVQYFDKGRMELTNPSSGAVTNGLLANELISGQLQVGDGTFQSHTAAAIPIAGDPDNAGPTYAALGTIAAALLNPTPAQTGSAVTTSVASNGTITPGMPSTGSGPTALTIYDGVTQHNVPSAFAAYRDQVGLLTIGYAKSEPFVASVKVAGVQRQVMVQVFERRVLTYTADNPDLFKVEMGNIGQHYSRWRYCTT